MSRRLLLVSLTAVAIAAPAFADSFAQRIERELRQQGFTQMTVHQTWLGRIRIDAQSANATREIVVNPNTGEILRDYTRSRTGSSQENILNRDHGGDGGSGGSSGSGSSGSGGSSGTSGSSGSGSSGSGASSGGSSSGGDHSSGGEHDSHDKGGDG